MSGKTSPFLPATRLRTTDDHVRRARHLTSRCRALCCVGGLRGVLCPAVGSEVCGGESGAAGEDISGFVEHPTEVEE